MNCNGCSHVLYEHDENGCLLCDCETKEMHSSENPDRRCGHCDGWLSRGHHVRCAQILLEEEAAKKPKREPLPEHLVSIVNHLCKNPDIDVNSIQAAFVLGGLRGLLLRCKHTHPVQIWRWPWVDTWCSACGAFRSQKGIWTHPSFALERLLEEKETLVGHTQRTSYDRIGIIFPNDETQTTYYLCNDPSCSLSACIKRRTL